MTRLSFRSLVLVRTRDVTPMSQVGNSYWTTDLAAPYG
jgi:hypothetical protein